jgi:23S rRNA pseudouridine2605 synthase
MRINKYIAQATRLSRRAADTAIAGGRVELNGQPPQPGADITSKDTVTLDGRTITPDVKIQTIMLHKPSGYVCSRDGQGSLTIYDLLPEKYQNLNSIGRLDRDSSGLLLLTNDGQLAQELSHPSHQKAKTYEITLDHDLTEDDRRKITTEGVQLNDGISKFELEPRGDRATRWTAVLREGRNRQLRRTFTAIDYNIINLHRTGFGGYQLDELSIGSTKVV